MISSLMKNNEKDTYILVSDGKEEIMEFFPENMEFFLLLDGSLDSSVKKVVKREKKS